MNILDFAEKCQFEILSQGFDETRVVEGAYCCDLLSWVIGRAKENDALVTVMSNPNVAAVAVMADLPCVILTEGVKPDEMMLKKAVDNGVAVLSSSLTTFETSVLIHRVLND